MIGGKAGALALAAILALAPPASGATCDRACLNRLAASFVDALVSRDWQRGVPWADRVRYSENGVAMTVGDGIWATVTRHAAAPLVIADPASASVVWLGSIEEHGQPAYLALRIRAAGDRIAEAEAVIRRKEGRPPYADAAAFAHDPAFFTAVPAPLPRRRLIDQAQHYLASLGTPAIAPGLRLAADCVRTENGVVMTGGAAPAAKLATGCAGQLRAGLFRDVDRLRGVSFPVVDAARGIVVATGLRDYSARRRAIVTPDGRPIPPDAPFPHSYAFAIAFKIDGGAITRIAETTTDLPYLMPAWAK